jgi:hypothetical protein
MSIKKLHLDRETLVRLTEEASLDVQGGNISPSVVHTVNLACRPSVLVACVTQNQTVCHVSQNTTCCPMTPACPTRTTTIPTTSEPTTIETSY